MDPFAVFSDLEGRWKTLTAAERVRADALLGSASRIIRADVTSVDDRIESGDLDPDLVVDIVCEMVRRAMTSDAGATQSSATIGSVSLSHTYANPMGNLYLTRAEIGRLSPAVASGKAFSVSTLPAAYA